ncbi:hypothetical protein PF049_09830 [Erythrobacteraceae bacterium WH01K]|nr:hypothetical protein PF049_09830 [Erythrobacteraceae bacterium WH01K]
MIRLGIFGLVLLAACSSQSDEERAARSTNDQTFEGIAILGAFEGQEFLICERGVYENCHESAETRCDLRTTGKASLVFSDFLEERNLQAEGRASIRMRGKGTYQTGGIFGHLGVNNCRVDFFEITAIEMTRDPFGPPPPP